MRTTSRSWQPSTTATLSLLRLFLSPFVRFTSVRMRVRAALHPPPRLYIRVCVRVFLVLLGRRGYTNAGLATSTGAYLILYISQYRTSVSGSASALLVLSFLWPGSARVRAEGSRRERRWPPHQHQRPAASPLLDAKGSSASSGANVGDARTSRRRWEAVGGWLRARRQLRREASTDE